jgi:hypothetical protein
MTKDQYKANRDAGRRGQGAYGSRKARRATEVHLNALNRRRQRAAK